MIYFSPITKLMPTTNFSVADIQAILTTCRDTGVSLLKIGNFSASFLPPEPKAPEVVAPTPEQVAASKAHENLVFLEQERRVKLDHLANLRLTNPEEYEELVARGELIHVGEEPDRADA